MAHEAPKWSAVTLDTSNHKKRDSTFVFLSNGGVFRPLESLDKKLVYLNSHLLAPASESLIIFWPWLSAKQKITNFP